MNGIILAGGRSSRFGENKAFVEVQGIPLIEKLVSLLQNISPEVYVVVNSSLGYGHLNAQVVEDVIKECGPLSGIHAGLIASPSFSNFITACDTPFLDLGLIHFLESKLLGFDAVVPEFGGRIHPLCGIYTKNCIAVAEEQLRSGKFKLVDFLKKINAKITEEKEIMRFKGLERAFFNMNTRQDYAAIS